MSNIIKGLPRFISGKLLPKLAYPVIIGPLKGLKFVLGSFAGEGGGISVYFNAIEVEQTASLVKNLEKNQVFFDIGANVGYYSCLASRLVEPRGQVIAIEPVIKNLYNLYRHIILNKVTNVNIIPAACANICSISSFVSGMNCALGYLANENDNSQQQIKNNISIVPTVTVDAIVKKLDIFPDVMKIDVEGAESLVLKGAQDTLLRVKPKIFLSVHSEILQLECMTYLKEFGYTFEELAPNEFLASCHKH